MVLCHSWRKPLEICAVCGWAVSEGVGKVSGEPHLLEHVAEPCRARGDARRDGGRRQQRGTRGALGRLACLLFLALACASLELLLGFPRLLVAQLGLLLLHGQPRILLALAALGLRLCLVCTRGRLALRLPSLLCSRLLSRCCSPLGGSLIDCLLLCRALAGRLRSTLGACPRPAGASWGLHHP